MAEKIAQWLDRLGLGQYAQAFAEHGIDLDILPSLSDDDLKELGLNLGDRRRVQRALRSPSSDEGEPTSSAPARDRTATTSEAERRQITVLFCDLVGSTALASRLDPEDMREVIRAYQDACSGVITRYDGYIAKFMGDGVYAYFGYPTAHEDDAERAITAGLGIVKTIEELNAKHGALGVRIGVATGIVAVGDLIGEGASEEAAIVGEAPNLAARLQAIAEPNTVVIGEVTYTLAGGMFEIKDLGVQDLKGFPDPVGAWSVLRARAPESRFQATRGEQLTELVGREEELGILLRRWQRAKEGEGQVVLISGEPGIGKSRLAQALQEEIIGEPHTRLRYQCSPYHTNSALHPIIEQFERVAGFEAGESPDMKLDKLETALAMSGRPVNDTAPLIASLLSIPADDRYPAINVSPQRQKELMLDSLVDQLVGFAEQQPVLFMFEDVHWVDPTTLEILELTVDRAADLAVLMLITYRPEFVAPWVGRPRVTPMILSRLERRDCALMVESVAKDFGIAEELRDRIATQTDGVPLFVEELTKSVLETTRGLDEPAAAIAVPATLQDSLESRLDRLGPAKELAQIGAAIGRNFDYDLLSRVAPSETESLETGLKQLIESGLVIARGEPPTASYAFKHALVQDAAYNSLLRTRRMDLHRRIASALMAKDPGIVVSEPELLAHHFTAAQQVEPAIDHWRAAGQKSMQRSANREAVEYLNRGLQLLQGMPESGDRDRKELELQTALGQAMMLTRGWASPEAAKCYGRARELCLAAGDERELFPILWGFWMIHGVRADQKAWHDTAKEMLTIARRQVDDAMLLQAHHASWGNPFVGNITFQLKHIEDGLKVYDATKHSSMASQYGGHDAGVCGFVHKGFVLWAMGYPEQSAGAFHAGLDLADNISHPPSVAHALNMASWLYAMRRDWSEVLRVTEEAQQLFKDLGIPNWIGRLTCMQGWAHVNLGAVDRGLSDIREGLEIDSGKRRGFGYSTSYTVYTEALSVAGMKEEALSACDEAVMQMRQTGQLYWEANILALKGDLHAERSSANLTDAETCYHEAIETARQQKARMWELRAATRLARLQQSQGKSIEARDLLAPVYDWFTEGFDTADLKEAKALLEDLS